MGGFPLMACFLQRLENKLCRDGEIEKQRKEDRAHYEREIRSGVRAFLVLGGSVTDIHRFVYEEMETLEW